MADSPAPPPDSGESKRLEFRPASEAMAALDAYREKVRAYNEIERLKEELKQEQPADDLNPERLNREQLEQELAQLRERIETGPPPVPPSGPETGSSDQTPKPPPRSNAAMWSAIAAIASLLTALLAFIFGIMKHGEGEGQSGQQSSVTGTVTSVVTGTVTVTLVGTPTLVTKPDP